MSAFNKSGHAKPLDKTVVPNNLLFDDMVTLLSEGYTVQLRAKGNSMFPFVVGDRDCVVLQKVANVQVDDIVLARLHDRGYVLHRIYHMNGDRMVLMGDGNVRGGEECRAEDVCGVVQKIIRNGKIVDCHSPKELRNVRLWRRLLPVRREMLAVWHRWRYWTHL